MSRVMYQIPILNLGSKWSETIDINNSLYRFHFAWNVNCKYWELNITDDYNNLLVGGIRVILNVNMLDEYSHLVDFSLTCIPKNDKREITLKNFATEFELIVRFDEG